MNFEIHSLYTLCFVYRASAPKINKYRKNYISKLHGQMFKFSSYKSRDDRNKFVSEIISDWSGDVELLRQACYD